MKSISEIQKDFTPSKIEGVKNLHSEIKKAKQNLQFAVELLTVIEFWNNRDEFTFEDSTGRKVYLLGNYYFFYDIGTTFKKEYISSIQHYLKMYLLKNGYAHPKSSQLLKLRKYCIRLYAFCENDWDRWWDVVESFSSTIKKYS